MRRWKLFLILNLPVPAVAEQLILALFTAKRPPSSSLLEHINKNIGQIGTFILTLVGWAVWWVVSSVGAPGLWRPTAWLRSRAGQTLASLVPARAERRGPGFCRDMNGTRRDISCITMDAGDGESCLLLWPWSAMVVLTMLVLGLRLEQCNREGSRPAMLKLGVPGVPKAHQR